jgi:RHS repeat-associated protein
MTYAPYGEPYAQAGTTDLSFTGQDQDTVSGMYDFLYRKYVPVQGRWLSPDPAGLAAVNPGSPQTWNRFAYVGNSPLGNIDPLGLQNNPVYCPPSVAVCGGGGDPPGNDPNTPGGGNITPGGFMDWPGSYMSWLWFCADPALHEYGCDDSTNEGITNALAGVEILSMGNFKCKDFFSALGKETKSDPNTLMLAVASAAGNIASNNYLYDGPSSTTELDSTNFPDALGSNVRTVGDWFAQGPGRTALSQYNGFAIFIASSDWAGWFSPFLSHGKANSYGLGTLMHEILHKKNVGGGFNHQKIANALNALDAPDYDLGRNPISDRIGKICF